MSLTMNAARFWKPQPRLRRTLLTVAWLAADDHKMKKSACNSIPCATR